MSSETLSILTRRIDLKIVNAYWEKRNLGVTTTEFTVEDNDTIEEIKKTLNDCTSGYQVLRLPNHLSHLLFAIQDLGFRFVEDMFSLKNDLLSSVMHRKSLLRRSASAWPDTSTNAPTRACTTICMSRRSSSNPPENGSASSRLTSSDTARRSSPKWGVSAEVVQYQHIRRRGVCRTSLFRNIHCLRQCRTTRRLQSGCNVWEQQYCR